MAEYIYAFADLKAAAGTAGTCQIAPPNATDVWRVKSISLLPKVTSGIDATNTASVRPYKGAGTGTPIAAARTNATVAMTVSVPLPYTLTGVGVDLEISQASPLHVDVSHAASGTAVDLGIVAQMEIVRGGL